MSGDGTPAIWDEAAEALPGMARIATRAAVRSAAWGLGTSVKTSRLFARALTDPETAGDLVQEVARDVAEATRTVSDVARAVSSGVPLTKALLDATVSLSSVVLADSTVREPEPEPSLRERGESLLQRSRDVWSEEETHPAYARILDDLAPDEARILLLLLRGGPQPSVDVRTGGPVGLVSSALVAPGMSMIGARAGCRYLDEVPAYLNNLFRLGLVWFSGEQVEDPTDYQVLEAQPDVGAAVRSVRFARPVRRSIHLTPFGTNFCRTCLVDPAEMADLPEHGAPED
ncbi:MAG: Abi-alpha family protein [Marmoricola sp.]